MLETVRKSTRVNERKITTRAKIYFHSSGILYINLKVRVTSEYLGIAYNIPRPYLPMIAAVPQIAAFCELSAHLVMHEVHERACTHSQKVLNHFTMSSLGKRRRVE